MGATGSGCKDGHGLAAGVEKSSSSEVAVRSGVGEPSTVSPPDELLSDADPDTVSVKLLSDACTDITSPSPSDVDGVGDGVARRS